MRLLFLLSLLLTACGAVTENYTLLIGTYTANGSRGIYRTTFDPAKGTLGEAELVVEVDNPSYLALSEGNDYLYAVSEGGKEENSALNAYRYDAQTGEFTLINRQPTGGASPCYVRLFDGKAYTANYTGGSLSTFAIGDDGSLGEAEVQEYEAREGSVSHIHGVFVAPDAKSLYVTDLGRSEIFQITSAGEEISRTQLNMGSGPRHMAFSQSKAYALNELKGTVCVFNITPEGLQLKQEIASDSVGGGGCADIHLSADGRFLYASNRLKADGVSVFSIDKQGLLQKVGYTLTGIHPRNFTLTPDGEYMLVAARDSNSVEVYRRDAETGLLTATGEVLEVSMPVCLVWLE